MAIQFPLEWGEHQLGRKVDMKGLSGCTLDTAGGCSSASSDEGGVHACGITNK